MASRRLSSRVLVVNPRDEVLMLVIRRADGSFGLMSPGGRLEPGEGEREAAVRELREETGIEVGVDALVGPLHRGTLGARQHVFFAVAVDEAAVDFTGHEPAEQEYVIGHDWLTTDALAGDARLTYQQLPQVARAAVESVRSAYLPETMPAAGAGVFETKGER